MQETWVQTLGWEDPLETGMATHSNILAWRIPWTEEPGGLQSTVWKRIKHDWVTQRSTAQWAMQGHLSVSLALNSKPRGDSMSFSSRSLFAICWERDLNRAAWISFWFCLQTMPLWGEMTLSILPHKGAFLTIYFAWELSLKKRLAVEFWMGSGQMQIQHIWDKAEAEEGHQFVRRLPLMAVMQRVVFFVCLLVSWSSSWISGINILSWTGNAD